jgi:glutathione synthase/RimK-type ligase-like ATP-grasp enzyme
MKNTIHLMTTSNLRSVKAGLNTPDRLIWQALQERGLAGACFAPNEISVVFDGDAAKLFYKNQELPPSALLVRSTRVEEEKAYEIATCFERLGGVVVDSPESLVYPVGKLLPFIHRQGAVKSPKSLFFTKQEGIDELIGSNFDYPFIVKTQKGFAGRGVSLIKSDIEWKSYIDSSEENQIIAQQYIDDIVDEFRVIVVGGKALGVVKKTNDGILKNASRGGSFEQVEDTDVTEFAEKAAKLEKASILGSDIVRTSVGNYI